MPQLPEDHKVELELFKKQVANHQLIIIKDEGIHRHLRFKCPDTNNQYFDIITWPGSLCYTGDMGTYVFSRLTDMFEFFRGSHDRYQISYSYWAEKIQSVDKRTGVSKFSPRIFKENIKTDFDNWAEYQRWHNDSLEESIKEKLIADTWERVEEEILCHADDSEYAAQQAAYMFAVEGSHTPRCGVTSRSYPFQDFYEYDCAEYTFSFLRCCWALRWGIALYDDAKGLTNG
jgi:hypothetical protein